MPHPRVFSTLFFLGFLNPEGGAENIFQTLVSINLHVLHILEGFDLHQQRYENLKYNPSLLIHFCHTHDSLQ
jgi:hypothetical protein